MNPPPSHGVALPMPPMNIEDQIKAVQSTLSLPADGVAGPKTWAAIHKYIVGKVVPIELPMVDDSDGFGVDARSEKIIATLDIHVQAAFRDLCRRATAAIAPKVWKWTSGYRSYAEQKKLHDAYKNGGPQATSPGNSAHNFAIACDGTVFAADGKTPIWDGPEYKVVGKLGRELGFHWGADFGDEPHFCKRPPWAEKMKELEMMKELRRRHEAGIPIWT